MKRLFILLLCLKCLPAMNHEEIDDKIKKLEETRISIKDGEILSLDDPFYSASSDSVAESKFNLQAVVDKVAKINNKWYKIGNEIFPGYKLVYISNGKVVVSDSGNYLELKLKGSENVKIK